MFTPVHTPSHPQRYLSCKLTYHDHTPDEYEPPHFTPMDPSLLATARFQRKPFAMWVARGCFYECGCLPRLALPCSALPASFWGWAGQRGCRHIHAGMPTHWDSHAGTHTFFYPCPLSLLYPEHPSRPHSAGRWGRLPRTTTAFTPAQTQLRPSTLNCTLHHPAPLCWRACRTLGSVATHHHGVTLKMKSTLDGDADDDSGWGPGGLFEFGFIRFRVACN
jgi:hypothetical protein